jgi:hypothetical protein
MSITFQAGTSRFCLLLLSVLTRPVRKNSPPDHEYLIVPTFSRTPIVPLKNSGSDETGASVIDSQRCISWSHLATSLTILKEGSSPFLQQTHACIEICCPINTHSIGFHQKQAKHCRCTASSACIDFHIEGQLSRVSDFIISANAEIHLPLGLPWRTELANLVSEFSIFGLVHFFKELYSTR